MSSGPARTPRSALQPSRALHPRGRRDRGARRGVRAHRGGPAETTIEIESDDPDEATLLLRLPRSGARWPPDARSACRRPRRRLALATPPEGVGAARGEVGGFVCDAGAGTNSIGASGGLHAAVGARRTAAAGRRPDAPASRPRGALRAAASIALSTSPTWPTSSPARREEATSAMLAAAVGAALPDLPPLAGSRDAAKCASNLLKGMQKGIKESGRRRAGSRTRGRPRPSTAPRRWAPTSSACAPTSTRGSRAQGHDRGGCYAGLAGAPTCLGHAAVAIASDLVDAAFGLDGD